MAISFILHRAKVLFNKSISKIVFKKSVGKVSFIQSIKRVLFNRAVRQIESSQVFTGTSYPLESYSGGNIAESYDTTMRGGLFYCTVWRAQPINS